MKFLITNAQNPMQYIHSGNIIQDKNHIHIKPNLQSFMLILVYEGTLFITKANKTYSIDPNQFITLPKGQADYVVNTSSPFSCYWVSFVPDNPQFCSDEYFQRFLNCLDNNGHNFGIPDCIMTDVFLIPEYGTVSSESKVSIMFSQLLDISKQENHCSKFYMNYALSVLMMEITQEYIKHWKDGNTPALISSLINWLKSNYRHNVDIKTIASNFGYNPKYLTTFFKKHTGYTMMEYIHKLRIDHAKSILSNNNISIHDIAHSVGFKDEKYFMKLFKQFEGLTPSQYKKSFYLRLYDNTTLEL